jgi:hypothetical protein
LLIETYPNLNPTPTVPLTLILILIVTAKEVTLLIENQKSVKGVQR